MKLMLRITLIAVGLAVAALPGVRADDSAPPPTTGDSSAAPQSCPCRPHGGARNRLQHLREALDLTQEQQNQIAAVFQTVGPQRQAIMNEPLSQADRRAKLHALKKDTQAKVRAVLTPDQQKKFDAMPHAGPGARGGGPDAGKHCKHGKHGPGGHEGGPGGEPSPGENGPPPGNP